MLRILNRPMRNGSEQILNRTVTTVMNGKLCNMGIARIMDELQYGF